MKVVYVINDVSHYRRDFLNSLGNLIDLTVLSFTPKSQLGEINYNYVELQNFKFSVFAGNKDEFFLVKKFQPDVILVGYNLHNIFRIMNFFRSKVPVIPVGLFYAEKEDFVRKILRKLLLRNKKVILTYSDLVTNKMRAEGFENTIISFNNTHIHRSDVKKDYPFNFEDGILKVLWVGTYKRRKKVEKLLELAHMFNFLRVRIIGPGIKENMRSNLDNVEFYDPCIGKDLDKHFLWSDMVINPGSVGLLVMTAAKYNRAILIEQNMYHGPEIQLAFEANQYVIDLNDHENVGVILNVFLKHRNILRIKGMELQQHLLNSYLIENMVNRFMDALKTFKR